MGKPSTMYSGSLLALTEPAPRTKMSNPPDDVAEVGPEVGLHAAYAHVAAVPRLIDVVAGELAEEDAALGLHVLARGEVAGGVPAHEGDGPVEHRGVHILAAAGGFRAHERDEYAAHGVERAAADVAYLHAGDGLSLIHIS